MATQADPNSNKALAQPDGNSTTFKPLLTLESLGPKTAYLYAFTGILLPWVGILCSGFLGVAMMPEWQSGMWEDLGPLLLLPQSTLLFWPFVGFSSWALARLVGNPTRAGGSPWVKGGLIVGIVLGAQYTVLFWSLFGGPVLVIVIAALVVSFYALLGSARAKEEANDDRGCGADLAVGCSGLLLVLMILTTGLAVGEPESAAAPFVVLVLAWPTSLLVTCATALARFHRSAAPRPTRPESLFPCAAIAGAIATYAAAWSYAIFAANQAYNKLPTEAPPDDCYVANAACRGHRRLVGAEWIIPEGGPPFLVNQQLRTLKAGELALKALLPRTHRLLRRAYDYAGPRAAACLKNPWAADAAYLSLIPAALACRLALRALGAKATVRRWPAGSNVPMRPSARLSKPDARVPTGTRAPLHSPVRASRPR